MWPRLRGRSRKELLGWPVLHLSPQRHVQVINCLSPTPSRPCILCSPLGANIHERWEGNQVYSSVGLSCSNMSEKKLHTWASVRWQRRHHVAMGKKAARQMSWVSLHCCDNSQTASGLGKKGFPWLTILGFSPLFWGKSRQEIKACHPTSRAERGETGGCPLSVL